MSQAVKRACDGCHRRKVKCDGTNPCRNCQTSTLTCTYNAIPQKKGPKGSRAKVISELRESQRATSFSAKIQQKLHAGNQQPPPQNPAFNPSPGMLSAKLVRACAEYFFTNMYSTMPILDQTQIESQIAQMEQNRDIYCMLASMCAFVVIQPGMDISPHIDAEDQQLMMQTGVNIVSSTLLLDEATRVRKGLDHLSPITYNGLVTNFFLLCCSYAIEDHNKAWYYLREASTMLYMGDMTVEDHLRGHSPEDAGRRRRLFWLFYCHERAYAIQRHRPTTLAATIKAPSPSDDPNEPYYNINPIELLSNIYRPMDDSFMTAWKKAGVHVTTPTIAQLQAGLDDFMRQYCGDLGNMERLKYDVQSWIKNLTWDSMNGNPDGSVAYQITREQLSSLASKFPRLNNGAPAVEAEFIEKLLQLTSNVIDYLETATNLNVRYRLSPSAFLRQIICIVSVIRGGNSEYLPLLYAKINELLPRMVDPMVNHAPQPQGLNAQFEIMPNIDIFDGFGNAGMAIPQMSMPVDSNNYDSYDNNYDQKFSPEEYDQKFTEMNGTPESSMNSSQPSFTPSIPQGNDMNTSFVGSPAMAYPGQNMNGFACSPLPDIMSPMSNPGQSDPMNQQSNHQHMTPGSLLNPGMMQQDVNSMMFNMHQGSQQNNFQMQGQQSMGNMGYQQLQRRNPDPSNIAMGMDYSYQ